MKLRALIFNLFVLIFFAIIVASCSKGSKDKPVLLKDQNDLWNIKGSISLYDYDKNSIAAKFYNGTDWTLTDVDIEILRPEGTNGKVITRRFRLNVCDTSGQCFKPFKNGEFRENIGDFLDGINTNDTKNAFSWGVVSAHGFKE